MLARFIASAINTFAGVYTVCEHFISASHGIHMTGALVNSICKLVQQHTVICHAQIGLFHRKAFFTLVCFQMCNILWAIVMF